MDTHSQPQKSDRDNTCAQLVSSAIERLEEHGPTGLSTREIAKDVNVSTQMIYTCFGGKAGLVEAIYEEGFRRLSQSEQQFVDQENEPMGKLRDIGRGYRNFALENPKLYRMMFGDWLEGFRLPEAYLERNSEAYQLLLETVGQAVEAGILGSESPDVIADTLWATVHGTVGLELSGFFENQEAAQKQYETAMSRIVKGFITDRSGR